MILLSLLGVWCTFTQEKPGFDLYGDPLPPGVLARFGSIRLRHDAGITCQAVSPDGHWLATGGGRTVRMWNLATGQQTQVLTLQSSNRPMPPAALAFSPDSRFLGALSSDSTGTVFLWDLQSGQLRYQTILMQREESGGASAAEVPFLAVLPQGQNVLVKNYGERSVRQFDLETGQEIRTFADGQSPLSTVAISKDGILLAGGTETRKVILWNIATGQELFRLPHAYPLVSIAFSANGQTLATLDQDLAPVLWDVKTGKEKLRLPARTRSVAVSFGPADQSLIVARQPDQLIVWDLASQKEDIVSVPRGWVTSAAYALPRPTQAGQQESQAGKTDLPVKNQTAEELLLGVIPRRNNSAKVRMIKLADSHPIIPFDGYENDRVYPFYLGKLKAWATIGTQGDDQLRLWDAQGRVTRTFSLPIHEQQLYSYATAPDGLKFVLGCSDGRILIADGSSGKTLQEISAFTKPCVDTEISSDGQNVIATDTRAVKVFDLTTGHLRTSYEIRDTNMIRVLISPDGSHVAAQSYQDDQWVLRLSEARTGKVIQETRPMLNTTSYFFGSDGRSLIYVGNRSTRNAQMTILECATGKVRLTYDLPSPYQYVSTHARISPDGRWLFATASGSESDQYAAIGWRLGTKDEPIILSGQHGSLVSVNYSTDSKQLLTLSNDSTMLTWDLMRYAQPTPAKADEKTLQTWWQQLADRDAARAYVAIHELAQQSQAADWIAKQINNQFKAVEPEHVQELIDRLDAAKFEERERATQTLLRMGSSILPIVRSALENVVSAEAKRRLQRIVEQNQEVTGIGGLDLQLSRAVEALEIMGTEAALHELRMLATHKNAIGAEARQATLRLGNRLALIQSSAATGEPHSGQ